MRPDDEPSAPRGRPDPRRAVAPDAQEWFTASVSAPCILFDLDGTLLDHEGSSAAAVLDALATWLPGVEVDDEAVVARWSELERVHMAEYLAGSIDFHEQRRRRLRAFLATYGGIGLSHDAEADATFAVYASSYERSWRAFDDVGPALSRLAATGAAVAILTNGDRVQQTAKVTSMALPIDVTVLVPADVGAAKPSPLAFVRACEMLGWAPDEVVYVGDNFEVDVRGSAEAGLSACWLNRSGGPVPDGVPVPHTRLTSLSELVTG